MPKKTYKSFANLFEEEYKYDFQKNIFQRWKFFLHLGSLNEKGETHDKYKLLSLIKILEDELHFLLVTTDKYHAKELRIEQGEAIVLPLGSHCCFKEESIIDVHDIDSISLNQATKLLRVKKHAKKRLIDQNEKLKDEYRKKLYIACKKTTPISTKSLFTLREIAGDSVDDNLLTKNNVFHKNYLKPQN